MIKNARIQAKVDSSSQAILDNSPQIFVSAQIIWRWSNQNV